LRLIVYPMLAVHYAEVGERGKAKAYINESLIALSRVGPSIVELRRLLSPYYSLFESAQWVAELPLYVYINATLAYMALGDVQSGLEMVEKAWSLVSKLAPNERVVVKALEAYLVALAYRRDENFDKIVEEYSEVIGRIYGPTYYVLKRLGANVQKIDERRRIDTLLITLFAEVFVGIMLELVIEIRSAITRLLRSEDVRLVLVKLYYDIFLNELLYV